MNKRPIKKVAPPPRGHTRRPDSEERQKAIKTNAQKRRRKRKSRVGLFYAFVLLIAVAIGVTLCLTVFFRIETIEIVGETRYSNKEIENYSQIAKDQNLFLGNLTKAKETIMQNLPYIDDVAVSRKMPSTVVLKVTEATPAGVIGTDEKWVIINAKGKVLEEEQGDYPPGIAEISGVEADLAAPGSQVTFHNPNDASVLVDLIRTLNDTGLGKITSIHIEQGVSVTLVYDDRVTMRIGTPTELTEKLAGAKRALEENISPTARGKMTFTGVDFTFLEDRSPPVESEPFVNSEAQNSENPTSNQ